MAHHEGCHEALQEALRRWRDVENLSKGVGKRHVFKHRGFLSLCMGKYGGEIHLLPSQSPSIPFSHLDPLRKTNHLMLHQSIFPPMVHSD